MDLRAADVFATRRRHPFAVSRRSRILPAASKAWSVRPIYSTLPFRAARSNAHADDNRAGSAPVFMIGYGFWQRLGAPSDIIGRVLPLDEVPRTIVGVAPPDFRVDVCRGQRMYSFP